MKETVVQNVGGSLLRLIAIAVLSLLHRSVSLELWAGAYLLASVVGTVYSIYRAYQILGAPSFDLHVLKEDAADGVYFSIGASAATVYNDVDKVMLGKVSFVAVGIYAAAYRIIDVSMTPIRSLVSAAYPRFFEKGVQGMKSTYPYALTQIGRASLYSVVLVPVLWIAAPLLPRILGALFGTTFDQKRFFERHIWSGRNDRTPHPSPCVAASVTHIEAISRLDAECAVDPLNITLSYPSDQCFMSASVRMFPTRCACGSFSRARDFRSLPAN